MNERYTTAIDAIIGVLKQLAEKMPATGEALQQALIKVEIALDNASTTPNTPADEIAKLLQLRQQLLTAYKYI